MECTGVAGMSFITLMDVLLFGRAAIYRLSRYRRDQKGIGFCKDT